MSIYILKMVVQRMRPYSAIVQLRPIWFFASVMVFFFKLDGYYFTGCLINVPYKAPGVLKLQILT